VSPLAAQPLNSPMATQATHQEKIQYDNTTNNVAAIAIFIHLHNFSSPNLSKNLIDNLM
jgi:hypothetical protein